MMYATAKKTLASIAATAVATAAIVVAAQPAFADDDPLKLGNLQVSPTSGQIVPADHSGWLEEAWTNEGEVCPAGFRERAGLYAVTDGKVSLTAVGGVIRKDIDYGDGIQGGVNDGETSVYRTGDRVRLTSSVFPWTTVYQNGATVELRHTCHDVESIYDPSLHPYYSIMIEVEAGGAWHVLGGPIVHDSSESDINVSVPTAISSTPTGLKISVKPGAATLTGAATRATGQVWTATGTLDNVTVNDDRRDAGAADWTLNGKVSDFASTSTTDTIPAANLGWTPAKVGGAGSAGAAVAIGTGLATDKPLATGEASAGTDVTTTVNAALALEVPATVAAGAYSATLTLTLI